MIDILVVDDSLIMRKILVEILTNMGFNIKGQAKSGKEAISMYRRLKPDLVTMDVNMPQMSGLEALKEIIKSYPNANVLMLTSRGDNDIVRDAIRYGAKGYLLKPPTPEKIRQYTDKLFPKTATKEVSPTSSEEKVHIESRRIDELSIRDSLTNLYTVQYIQCTIKHLMALHDLNSISNIDVINIFIDNFDEIKDEIEAKKLNNFIKDVAFNIQNSINDSDFAIKIKDNEFAVVTIGKSEEENRTLSESILSNVEKLSIAQGEKVLEGLSASLNPDLYIYITKREKNESLVHLLERIDNGKDKITEKISYIK